MKKRNLFLIASLLLTVAVATKAFSKDVTVIPKGSSAGTLEVTQPITLTNISNYQGADVSFRMDETVNMETFELKYTMGSLTLDAPATPKWQVGKFSLPVSFYDYETNYDLENFENSEDVYAIGTLLNQRTPMEAQQVEINLGDTKDEEWLFFSVPFDVKVSEIKGGRGNWVIRRYDPTLRAAVQSGWTAVGEDETLHAGEGYIFMRNYNELYDSEIEDEYEETEDDYRLILPAAETDSKQNIFAYGDVVVPLKKSAATMSHNADWNFVGNPYPCYFDISAIKEHVTIYIFDEREGFFRSFDTSVSQGIVLAPCQTFFVQGTDVSQLTFQASGRKAQSASFGISEIQDDDEDEEAFSNVPAEVRQRLKAKAVFANTSGSSFDPESPFDPGANYFNPVTGEAYFDLFPQNRFYNAIRNLFDGNASYAYESVKTVTVAAPLGANDFYFLLFSQATTIDLGQSSGFQTLPAEAFSYLFYLRKLVLPACVTAINDKAFSAGATQFMSMPLQELDIYATTPPAVTENAFNYLKDKSALIVRVPKEALAAYKAADVWKNLNIQPLDGSSEELQSVTLLVQGSDGRDVTDQCNILWTDAEGELLGTGNTLNAQPVGSTVTYSIGLSSSIAALYVPVTEGTYTVQADDNTIIITLETTGVADLGSKELAGSQGIIEVSFVASDSEAPTVFNSADVVLTINKVSGEAITDFVLQYPNVLFEKTLLEAGQTLRLEVTSRSNLFQSAQTEVTVDEEGIFSADLTVKEWGQANITCTPAPGVNEIMALVFDQNEKYVCRFAANGNVIKVKDLADGAYKVVAIQQNQFLNAIATLTDLRQTVLQESEDYALLPIQLTAGTTSQYEATVPDFDLSRISHISSDSYVATNDPEVNIATNATLKSKVVFKQDFATQVSNLQLIVDIPDGLQFAENSVMSGGGSYQLTGQRLIIPCQQDEQVRWCLTSNKSGQKTVSVMVQYILGGQQYLQPIGSATINVTGISLNMVNITNTPRVNIKGNAYGGSHITIYDGRAIVAETTARSNGSFSAEITLNPALDGTRHKLYADVETNGQPTFSTETSTVLYDKQASVLNKVTMLYQNQRITWNEQTGIVTPSYFNVDPNASSTATFTASFINPKPDCILDPYFQVGASDGSYRTFDATWNEAQQRYTAVADYPDIYRMPVNVQFLYLYADSTAYNRQEIFDAELNTLVSAHNQLVDGVQNTVQVNEVLEDEEDRFVVTFSIGDEEGYKLIAQVEDYDYVLHMQEELERPIIRDIVEGDTLALFFTINNELSTTLYFANLNQHEAYSETIKSPTSEASARRKISFAEIVGGIKSIANPSNLKTLNEKIDKANGYAEQANQAIEALNYIDEMQACYDEYNTILSNRLNLCQYALLARCPNGDLRVPSSMFGHFQEAIRRLDSDRRLFCSQMQSLILSYANALENAGYKEIAKQLASFMANYCAKNGLSKGTTKIAGKLSATGMGTVEQFTGMIEDGFNSAIDMGIDWIADQITKNGRVPTDYAGVRKFFEYWAPKEFHKNSMAVTDLFYSIKASYEKCEEEKCDRPEVPWADEEQTRPIIDPSGFVYEGLMSNRVEGVEATIYYKEDEGATEQLWNAEEFGQQNPITTDAAGLYMWNVPQGIWQVRFQKDGYQPAQTEWLPVPPPQLEVNIPMNRIGAPEVKSAEAFSNYVSIAFDCHMKLPSLAAISVVQNGQNVQGAIEPLDAEDDMVRNIRFVPNAPFSSPTVGLTIPATATNYTGTAMEADYEATLTVQHTIEGLLVQDNAAVQVGQTGYVSVQAYPAEAVSGRELRVTTSSPLVEIAAEELLLDEDGQCMVPLKGLLPGQAEMSFAIGDLQAQARVDVKDHLFDVCAQPVSIFTSGTVLPAGTEVELYCATPGAVIYYTLDGSCPCDEQTRMVYTQPIVVTQPVTIRAMAVCEGMDDSEVVTYTYTITEATDIAAPEQEVVKEEFYYDLSGKRLQTPSQRGIYIHVQRTEQGIKSKKIYVK